MQDLLVVALAASFVVTAIERFVDLSFLRGFVALAASAVGVWLLNYEWGRVVLWMMDGAFLALILILIGERLATPPPIALERTRRGL